jgi:hypothetical protein
MKYKQATITLTVTLSEDIDSATKEEVLLDDVVSTLTAHSEFVEEVHSIDVKEMAAEPLP